MCLQANTNIEDKCFPKAFWQSTGSNDIIDEIVATATPEVTENLHKLLSGESVTTYIDTGVIYPQISYPSSFTVKYVL